MDWLTAVWVALIGYLAGSISFARVITRLVKPQADISKVEELVPGSDVTFTTDSVSATAVRVHVGTRYGVLTALLDMAKVFIPVLALRLWQPEQPYYLIAAAAGLIGHDYPLFFKFKGGRGESPIIGGMLAIDPLGLILMNIAGAVLGMLIGHLLILRWGGLILLIPWLWFTTHDPWALGYIVLANLVYWYSMYPELSQYARLLKTDIDPSQEEIARFMGMGLGLGRFMDRYSLTGWLNRRKASGN
jgi:glycerol-3-phosphate acyltransferase PlsY